jgi:hypothetical protein
MTSMGDYAFAECASLATIWIGASVAHIDSSAFHGSTNLSSINVVPLNMTYSSLDGVLFDKTPDHTGAVSGRETRLQLHHSRERDERVDYCFEGSDRLTSIVISANISSIGSDAFSGCSSIQEITVAPANKTYSSVDGVLFNEDRTTLIKYPAGRLADTYTVPGSVIETAIGKPCLYFSGGCTHLAAVTLGEGVTAIGNGAFAQCGISPRSPWVNGSKPSGKRPFGGARACSGCAFLTASRTWRERRSGTALRSRMFQSAMASRASVTMHFRVAAS